ncbi:hypothetical protein C9I56_09215 [Paraburkholderia caribensis]|jgi:hypothetical protein|uniref:Transposase n=1 Tax=Paraburkholderia caribensis TaxID=75105 RepID=A0A9Q6WQG4_9BURK|nr:hypothetical protein AN416_31850 [Paraburkholderia caribensis]AMV47968.1 hypothetical protein ATN79_45705 [Paraburkholderia caribensis]AUT56993.1 hypothetical protein C2L66_34845 [Paraburkholderia caribensis]PTB29143.1 hypothetical protein C9I56_09215 [Paraburkholderia caribensis]QLB66889.1 hypothetical protein A9O66_30700 [Paraburkholderia caribensis]
MHDCGVSRTIRTQKALRRCAKPVRPGSPPIAENPHQTRLAKKFSGRSNNRDLIDWKLIA